MDKSALIHKTNTPHPRKRRKKLRWFMWNNNISTNRRLFFLLLLPFSGGLIRAVGGLPNQWERLIGRLRTIQEGWGCSGGWTMMMSARRSFGGIVELHHHRWPVDQVGIWVSRRQERERHLSLTDPHRCKINGLVLYLSN